MAIYNQEQYSLDFCQSFQNELKSVFNVGLKNTYQLVTGKTLAWSINSLIQTLQEKYISFWTIGATYYRNNL